VAVGAAVGVAVGVGMTVGLAVGVALPDDEAPLTLIAVGGGALPTSTRTHWVVQLAPTVTLPVGLLRPQTDCHSYGSLASPTPWRGSGAATSHWIAALAVPAANVVVTLVTFAGAARE
jgi:hypothetical protein